MAEDPSIKSLTAGQYTLVAEDITLGSMHKKAGANQGAWYYTYRIAGEAAPTLLTEGIPWVEASALISFDELVDVYVWVTKANCTLVVHE